MAITNLDSWIAAAKQRCLWQKTAARTVVAGTWFSLFDLAGSPGAGALAIGNTANGVVPTDVTAGYPIIQPFGGGATGYLGRAFISNTVQSRIRVYDRLFAAGAYAFNANVNLSSQPSYNGRVPQANFNGLELWVETVVTGSGNLAVNVTYTNQAGVGSRQTGAVGIGAVPTVGRCWQLPLAAGDSGVQKIDNVTASVASAGITFNVMILRPLFDAWVANANQGDVYDFLRTGLPQVFTDSALYMLVMSSVTTSSGQPICEYDISNG